jgi:exocyst complex component 2
MALDVVKLYISLISEFFVLSDMAVMASSNTKVPPLLPANSHSISTAYYLLKMLNDIQETVNELNLMEISTEASAGLKTLLESTKWRFEDVLITAWLRGDLFFRMLKYPRSEKS